MNKRNLTALGICGNNAGSRQESQTRSLMSSEPDVPMAAHPPLPLPMEPLSGRLTHAGGWRVSIGGTACSSSHKSILSPHSSGVSSKS